MTLLKERGFSLRVLIIFVCILMVPVYANTAIADDVIVESEEVDLRSLAAMYAELHGANSEEMIATIDCENAAWDPSQQSLLEYNFSSQERMITKGEQERSYGLAMIHIPDHPTISIDMAKDPHFALDWMAKEFASGREWQWTCYRKLFN